MIIETEVKLFMEHIIDDGCETITELVEEVFSSFDIVNKDWVWDMAAEIFYDYSTGT